MYGIKLHKKHLDIATKTWELYYFTPVRKLISNIVSKYNAQVTV